MNDNQDRGKMATTCLIAILCILAFFHFSALFVAVYQSLTIVAHPWTQSPKRFSGNLARASIVLSLYNALFGIN